MRAARILEDSRPLVVDDVADPDVSPGSVRVRVVAAMVHPALVAIRDGDLPYVRPPKPFAPGLDAIGEVVETTNGTGLSVGQLVYCDTYFRSAFTGDYDDTCFLGNFGVGPDAAASLARWPNGCLADHVTLPAECLVPLAQAEICDPLLLCRLGWLGTAYGAFLKAGLRNHHTLIVTGATGLVGTSAVLVALALGVRRIVVAGRNKDVLERLVDLAPNRIVAVPLSESLDEMTMAFKEATGRGAHVALDAISATDQSKPALAAIRTLRRNGSAALVGNVAAPLELTYGEILDGELTVTGSNWFPRRATPDLLALVASGLLDLSSLDARCFNLDDINAALAAATSGGTGFSHVAIRFG